ncbi:MAG: carbohydrate kinase family protein [Anaerolineales bacterium]|jgi:sugar/nucleoside kinase (ribokinase family)
MVDYVVYGKIIIDDIRLKDGEIVRNQLGGGGPQGAFGARLWDSSVGILTRSGTDIDPGPKKALEAIGIDLEGWVQYPDLPTPHGLMAYDENEYMLGAIDFAKRKEEFMRKMGEMLSREIPIPEKYQSPKVIHLITEFTKEPMAQTALRMKKEKGAIYSLEPIIDWNNWTNKKEMIEYFPEVDIVTPDWPSASGIAGSESPLEVVKFWSKLGPSLVAVRHGANGSYVWDSTHDEFLHVPIAKVETVDPTGCGNSYGGGLMAAWEKHRDARIAGAAGTVSASYLAKSLGVPPVTESLQKEAQGILEELLDRIKPL